MEYILVILVTCLILLIAQRCVPASRQKQAQWLGVCLLSGMAYQLVIAPFRVARIWYDLTHLLG